jgi:DNA double-strand break repair helicase HerA and related ATPase
LESDSHLLGIVVGQTKPHYFHFLARRPISMGEYVTVDSSEGRLLGLAEDSATKSDLLDKVSNFETAVEAKRVAAKNVRDKSYVATVKVVGLLEALRQGNVVLPSLPPEPGSDVLEAKSNEIGEVFGRKEKQWVEVGSLLRNQKVRVSVNVDKLASRHLAVMSVTGSGKSNLLALITKKIAELRGTMILFDYHGEYSELDISGVIHADAKINPRHVDPEQLADLIDVRENAEVQRTVLSSAFTDEVRADKEFWDSLLTSISAIGASQKQYKRAADRLQDIVKMAIRRMKSVIDPDIGDVLDQLKPSRVNILNMLEFTERQANAAISYYLEEILDDRKRATRLKGGDQKVRFRTPVICAIEEAHAFIPSEGDSDTKYIASKVAREGRKFGISLIAVSQRPRRMDQDVLSQMGSLAIMKLTNPEDQNHIREASEAISEDLLRNLPSLNVGEAVLLGDWVSIPSVVKIDFVKEKRAGADVSATALWAGEEKMKAVAKESTSSALKLE